MKLENFIIKIRLVFLAEFQTLLRLSFDILLILCFLQFLEIIKYLKIKNIGLLINVIIDELHICLYK